jgi:hypothetical protein
MESLGRNNVRPVAGHWPKEMAYFETAANTFVVWHAHSHRPGINPILPVQSRHWPSEHATDRQASGAGPGGGFVGWAAAGLRGRIIGYKPLGESYR